MLLPPLAPKLRNSQGDTERTLRAACIPGSRTRELGGSASGTELLPHAGPDNLNYLECH